MFLRSAKTTISTSHIGIGALSIIPPQCHYISSLNFRNGALPANRFTQSSVRFSPYALRFSSLVSIHKNARRQERLRSQEHRLMVPSLHRIGRAVHGQDQKKDETVRMEGEKESIASKGEKSRETMSEEGLKLKDSKTSGKDSKIKERVGFAAFITGLAAFITGLAAFITGSVAFILGLIFVCGRVITTVLEILTFLP